MLKAAKRAAVESLGTYALIAFGGSLPAPMGYPVAVWTLPSLFLAFFVYGAIFSRPRHQG